MKTTLYFSVQTQNEETYCYAEKKKFQIIWSQGMKKLWITNVMHLLPI